MLRVTILLLILTFKFNFIRKKLNVAGRARCRHANLTDGSLPIDFGSAGRIHFIVSRFCFLFNCNFISAVNFAI